MNLEILVNGGFRGGLLIPPVLMAILCAFVTYGPALDLYS